jgi:hypothetical protein
MKSIIDILGGVQILLGVTYDLQDNFEEYLNTDHHAFFAMLRVIEEYLPPLERTGIGMGRPAYENVPFFRTFLGMSFFRIASIEALRNRLLTDSNLRQICGFSLVPSLARRSGNSTLSAREVARKTARVRSVSGKATSSISMLLI